MNIAPDRIKLHDPACQSSPNLCGNPTLRIGFQAQTAANQEAVGKNLKRWQEKRTNELYIDGNLSTVKT
jgi:hypothetical protein